MHTSILTDFLFLQLVICLFLTIMEPAKATKQKVMRAAQYEKGGPEKLYVGMVPLPQLKEKEVMVKVIATTVNRADTLQRQGGYPSPPGTSDILGLDAAGIVDSLGPGSSRWAPGDRVMALLPGGGNAEFVAAHEDHLIRIPDSLTFVEAAAIPEAWLTAFQIISFVGGVQPNETVLIHAGGSGVGTAAIQLAKVLGARAVVTAGSKEKLDAAIGLGAIAGVNYKEESFVSKVMEVTEGQGVNLILDCVGGSLSQQNCDSVARDGRWVLYGTMGGADVPAGFLRHVLMKRIRLVGSTLRTRSNEYKAQLVKEFSEKIVPKFATKELKLIIDTVFPFGKIGEAHQYMEDNKNTGKIVIQVQSEESPTSPRADL